MNYFHNPTYLYQHQPTQAMPWLFQAACVQRRRIVLSARKNKIKSSDHIDLKGF